MRVGLTYDLRDAYLALGYGEEETAEFDRVDTIEHFEREIHALGHETVRIGHGRELVEALARGERWDLVFNIAEGLHGIGREAQVPAILDLFRIPYTFSDPMVMALTLDKAATKRVVRDAGIRTADFAVVSRPEDAGAVTLEPPLFVKPVAEGTGKGVTPASILRRREELEPACRRLLERYRQPVLVETLLPGRELTVGIWGTGPEAEAIGTLEVILLPGAEAGVYSYVNKERCEELVEYRLAPADDPVVRDAEELALAAWRVLGCRDAGRVDLRCDDAGRPSFLEVNPLAGLHPEHSDLPILCSLRGIPYRDLVARILREASKRVTAETAAPALVAAAAA